jgi:hypothetical protein
VQIPQGNGSSPTPNLAPVDAMGAFDNQYMGDLAKYNAEVGSQNSLFNLLFGLGGAALGAPVGTFSGPNGLLAGLGSLFKG